MAERALGRIETEAATLAAILATNAPDGRTPVIDAVKVDAGFEAALGAAFGDDLDAPADEDGARPLAADRCVHATPRLPDERRGACRARAGAARAGTPTGADRASSTAATAPACRCC